MSLPSLFDKYRPALEKELRASISSNNLFLYDMLRYHMGWVDQNGKGVNGASGKALRPMMCLLACEAAGGDWRKALPPAVSLELVHNFSLIHDDIQDGDKERRHRSTVWYLWGEAQAINAGDSMRGLGSLNLIRKGQTQYPPERLLMALEALEKASLEMIEGQYLDISYEKDRDTTVEQYLDMISKKTGALMECSFYLGALVGSDSPQAVEGFRKCGKDLGLAFQIRDDVLGVWGKEESTGKPIAADIRRKKKTLPMIHAMQTARGKDRDTLNTFYDKQAPEEGDVATVLRIMDQLETQPYCQSMARKYAQQALDALKGIPLSEEMHWQIKQLAEFFLAREH